MGVEVERKKAGDGQRYPKPGDRVAVHYTGTLKNGTQFDSSRDRGKPLVFTVGVGQVIRGWDEGIPQLSVGERATLTCSPDYAYGERGAGGVIPPNAELTFDVELVDIGESAGGAGGETNVTFWLVLFAVALTLYTLYYNYHARKHEAGKAAQETLSADW